MNKRFTVHILEPIMAPGQSPVLVLRVFDEGLYKEWAGVLTLEDKSADEIRSASGRMIADMVEAAIRDV